MSSIRIIKVQSWQRARLLADRLRYFLFRGQEDADWSLSTSIERAADRWNAPISMMPGAERNILAEFKRRAHHFVRAPPADNKGIEWLALIQHFGGPTRLLDISRSFYVAAFLAMENADRDAAVWAFNRKWMLQRCAALLGEALDGTLIESNRLALDVCDPLVGTDGTTRAVVPVEPFRMNERLAAQQGGFLFPTSGGHRFADNLAALLDEPAGTALLGGSTEDFDPGDATLAPVEESTILKVILPREIHTDAIINLEDMNVSSASLFGGLDGFARSLTRSLRIFDRIPNARRIFDGDES